MLPESLNVIITGGQGPSPETNLSFVVSVSRDTGNTWTRCNLSSTQNGWCYALAVAPSAPEVIYAAGQVNGPGAVYRSTDRGVSWLQTASAPAGTVFGLAVLPSDPGRVIAVTPAGAFLTTNAGVTWTDVGAGTGFRAVALHPFGPDTVVVAGDFGVEVSRDGGQNWAAMNDGLDTLAVTSLAFVGDGGQQLIAGTAGRGCFVSSLFSAVNERRATPDASRAAPIPTIVRGRLILPASGVERDASCVLLDITGRSVMKLGMGSNDVSRVAPGVYFVRLASDRERRASGVSKVLIGR